MELQHTYGKQNGIHEEIYAFPEEAERPFRVIMAGITYPDASYRIERKKERNHIFVFEYVMEGRGHLEIDGMIYEAKAGDTYILTPNTEQCYFADKNEPFKKIWVNIESAYLSSLLQAHGLSSVVYHFNSYNRLCEILELAKSGRSEAAVSAEVAPIILSLIEAISTRFDEKKDPGIAQLAKQRIDGLAGVSLDPKALAEELHVSLSTLTRAFQTAYGCTPYEYHLLYREKMAKSLLQNTGLSAKEIAYRLGFSDEHYFSNFFKKRTGLRPAEYKKEHRLEK